MTRGAGGSEGRGELTRDRAPGAGRKKEKETLFRSPRMRPCEELRLMSRTVLSLVTVTETLQSPSLDSLPNTTSDSAPRACKLIRTFRCEDLKTKVGG